MHIVMFYHSLLSDWNHGNAHFLRGMVTELLCRGHDVDVFEPLDGWSYRMLVQSQGRDFLGEFHSVYPHLTSTRYRPDDIDLDEWLQEADLVIVHEWNEPELVNRIAEHRRTHRHYRLLFHDTHHRSLSVPEQIKRFNLRPFDGVLAFGEQICHIYLKNGWTRQAWVWHEAADVRVFRPMPNVRKEIDLVWVGNWGDDERTAQIREFLIEPSRELGLKTRVYGVQYTQQTQRQLAEAGIEYKGWTPNFYVPRLFARARATVHIPRCYYTEHLPGIPTIRPFEAMACGIPMVCAPWEDSEHLFRPGIDYLIARNAGQMRVCLREIVNNPSLARSLSQNSRQTILKHHTCAHRADELMEICVKLGLSPNEPKTRNRNVFLAGTVS
jgi:spore maturation protein CgeB